jgi:hypothetical protein
MLNSLTVVVAPLSVPQWSIVVRMISKSWWIERVMAKRQAEFEIAACK